MDVKVLSNIAFCQSVDGDRVYKTLARRMYLRGTFIKVTIKLHVWFLYKKTESIILDKR
jgi:hypothetical protein